MSNKELVSRYAKIIAVKEVFSTHPYWDTSNGVYPNEDVLAEWYDAVINGQPPTQRVRDMCEPIHDVTDGTTAYDIEDALDTDGDYMYVLCEQYEFSEPYALLEEKYRAFEAHLTEFIKYMEEAK